MFDFITEFLFDSLPIRVQLGCLAVFLLIVVALLAWAYFPETW